MFDGLLYTATIVLMASDGLIVIVGPWIIGRSETGTYTGGWYLSFLVTTACHAMIAGRVFGWW